MNEAVTNMQQNRNAFAYFSMLCNAIKNFSSNKNEKTIEELKGILTCINGNNMPLPSGRYGNSLAVALEMQYYQGALFIIQHAEELGIDLSAVSFDSNGKDVWDAQQVFELSQLGFNTSKIASDDDFYKDYPEVIQSMNANIDAATVISIIFQDKSKKNNR